MRRIRDSTTDDELVSIVNDARVESALPGASVTIFHGDLRDVSLSIKTFLLVRDVASRYLTGTDQSVVLDSDVKQPDRSSLEMSVRTVTPPVAGE